MRELFRAVASAAALLVAAAAVAAPGGTAQAAGSDGCRLYPATVAVVDGRGRPVPGAKVSVSTPYGCPSAAEGATGADGRWTGRIPLQAPAGDGLVGTYEGVSVSADLRSAGGATESASYMADATGNTVTVGGDSAGGLRVDAYLPLIEGPATLKTGQVATYRVIAPQALIDSVAYPGAPADSFADPVQWEVDPALTALVPHGPSRPGGMFRGPLTIEVRADRPGKATLDAVIGPGEVAMDVTVLPLELPSITLDGPRELRVGSKGGYIAYPVHAVGPVSWSIDGRQYGDLSPAGAAAVLRALKPGTVVVVAEVQGEGGQVARASERVRIVAPPGPPVWEILLPLLAVLLLLLLVLAARRRRRAREDGTA